MNNVLIVLKLCYKLMFQFFVHVRGWVVVIGLVVCSPGMLHFQMKKDKVDTSLNLFFHLHLNAISCNPGPGPYCPRGEHM